MRIDKKNFLRIHINRNWASVLVSYSFFTLFRIPPRRKFSNCVVHCNCHSINTIYIASNIYESWKIYFWCAYIKNKTSILLLHSRTIYCIHDNLCCVYSKLLPYNSFHFSALNQACLSLSNVRPYLLQQDNSLQRPKWVWLYIYRKLQP